MQYYQSSLKIREEINDIQGLAYSYKNIGAMYDEKGDMKMALEYYKKSLKKYEEVGDKYGLGFVLTSIGGICLKSNDMISAIIHAEKAYKISKELGFPENIEYAAELLKKINEKQGNYSKTYEYFKEEITMRDSINNKENSLKTQKLQAKFEYEKKAVTDSIAHSKAMEIKDLQVAKIEEEKKKQRILLFSFLAGFIIILVFSVFLYRLFVQKKIANAILAQQKEEISAQRDEIETQRDLVTHQKDHIEEIHKETTDSINYAKRIQEAVLPVSVAARAIMGDHFVLFKPKDIVSGDFYWTAQISTMGHAPLLVVAVADCTGHGVPGAFMSMLGISFLNEIVNKQEIVKANEILNQLRKEIINALQQKGEQGEQKDGMDISLCVINTNLMECQWSGANNPLWLVRNSENLTGFQNLSGLEELKPDKQPIAIHIEMKDFTNHEIQLYKGDTIYLASDGYEDQFGGPKYKKFMSKKLKQLLQDNCDKPMNEQKNILETTFENWKGEHEQIDDVTILGLKI